MSVDSMLHSLNKLYYKHRYTVDEKRKIADTRNRKSIDSFRLTTKQKQEIDSFFQQNYGRKIPYDWHRLYSSYTGNFDVRYVPDTIFLSEIETYFVDYKHEKTLSDKNILPLLVKGIPGTRTAQIILSKVNETYTDGEMRIISRADAIDLLGNADRAFMKPSSNSSSGRNCTVLQMQDGVDNGSGMSAEELIDKIIGDFNVQERLINHDVLSDLHSSSVNTFRVTTYIWREKVYHFPLLLRIGRGGNYLDNAHQGGMFVGVDDHGNLGKAAYTEFRETYTSHPDSGIVFEGYQISQVPNIIKAAKTAQARLPQVGMISWDLTLGKGGEIVFVEANIKAQTIWMSQMSNGKGAFGDNTADVLRCIRKNGRRLMKRKPYAV